MDLNEKLKMLAEVEMHGVADVDLHEFFDTLEDAGVQHEITKFEEDDIKNYFYELLDDMHEEVQVGGLTFSPSEVFKSTASEQDQNYTIHNYIDGNYLESGDHYFSVDEVEQFYRHELDDYLEDVKQYVIEQEGYEENSSQARAIESANDFTDLHSRYAVLQSSSELKSAISEVQGETQSPGLADIGVQSNTERQSKVRKM